ncbi:MAG: radical SAM protein [Planctomycetes bacterium]|nr:radical SAM protein [Planctomycetota bacterium]
MMNPHGKLPLDSPKIARPHRVYVALTNACNRACPWCSTCSSPRGTTFLPADRLAGLLPAMGDFELQLEGGEPTIHPEFWQFVEAARMHERCKRVVICTNGAVLPRERLELENWVARLGTPLTLKLSWNHYLLEHDAGLPELARALRAVMLELGGDRLFVLNVRLRRGVANDDAAVLAAVESTGLKDCSNIFFLQRYGFAAGELAWEEPFLAGTNFRMVNPDGRSFGTDLVARSVAMGELP